MNNFNHGFRKAFIKNSELPAESRFLTVLLFCYVGKNRSCWPSINELSKRFGRNRDTTRKYLKILEANGHLRIEKRGIGRSNLYTPSYFKLASKATEESILQPDELALNRSIDSGNKDSDFITGKTLIMQKKREWGL